MCVEYRAGGHHGSVLGLESFPALRSTARPDLQSGSPAHRCVVDGAFALEDGLRRREDTPAARAPQREDLISDLALGPVSTLQSTVVVPSRADTTPRAAPLGASCVVAPKRPIGPAVATRTVCRVSFVRHGDA